MSQMKYRLSEGQGEAVYYLGVEDDGTPVGLSPRPLEETLDTLERMINALNCCIISKVFQPGVVCNSKLNTKTVRVLIRENVPVQLTEEVRGIVLGGAHSGKSTLIASLRTGYLDDGLGLSRMHVFRHKHELDNGHTSSVSTHCIAFDNDGIGILEKEEEMPTNVFFNKIEISRNANRTSKIITLIDVAGHQRYLKTAWKGLTTYSPTFAIVTIPGQHLLTATSTAVSHWRISMAMGLHVLLVVTKGDLVELSESQVLSAAHALVVLATEDEEIEYEYNPRTSKRNVVGIFVTSSVSALEGIDDLREYLGSLSVAEEEEEGGGDCFGLLRLRECYNVVDVGMVCGGVVRNGSFNEGDAVGIGPDSFGNFVSREIVSIRNNQGMLCLDISSGCNCSINVGSSESLLNRKGCVLVLLGDVDRARKLFLFEFKIRIIFPSQSQSQHKIQSRNTFVVYGDCVRQTAVVLNVSNGVIRIKFIKHPEYLLRASRIILSNSHFVAVALVL